MSAVDTSPLRDLLPQIIRLVTLMEVLRRSHPRKVAIHVVEQRAHVWEADDVAFIRREHHICGLMTGTLPAVQQQNVFLGIPQQLFPEEVVYLMRAGAAFIVDDVTAHTPSSEEQRRKHWAEYEADAEAQRQEAHQKSLARGKDFEDNLSHLTSIDVDGNNSQGDGLNERQIMAARKAVEKRQRREAAKKIAGKQKEADGDDGVSASQKVQSGAAAAVTPQVENKKDIAVALGHSHLTEGTSSSYLWYKPTTEGSASSLVSVYETLSSALKAGVWHYPRTASERSRCSVFEDLQSKGFYLGVGLRFGGDFVVYPGDPMRYHSHFTASVQAPAQAISGLELVGAGRLGTAVKKAHLLCGSSLDEAEAEEDVVLSGRRDSKESSSWGHVDYYSLTWAGFGT